VSILNAFHPNSETLINAAHFAAPIADFPKIAVGAFKAIEPFLQTYGAQQIANRSYAGWDCPIWRVRYNDTDIAVFHAMLGGPTSANLIEGLRCMGAERFLFYGSCGVLDHDIAAGNILIPTAAYRDEGTSYHYAAPEQSYIEIPTAARLHEILRGMGLPCMLTQTWTTDAFYRETRAAMQARKAEGCAAVDMECASIMAMAQFYGLPIYQMFAAEDCLDGSEWQRRTSGNLPKSEQEKLLQIALEVACEIERSAP